MTMALDFVKGKRCRRITVTRLIIRQSCGCPGKPTSLPKLGLQEKRRTEPGTDDQVRQRGFNRCEGESEDLNLLSYYENVEKILAQAHDRFERRQRP